MDDHPCIFIAQIVQNGFLACDYYFESALHYARYLHIQFTYTDPREMPREQSLWLSLNE